MHLMYEVRFRELQAERDKYFVRVIEDKTTGKLVASATLVIEKKFVHGNGLVCIKHLTCAWLRRLGILRMSLLIAHTAALILVWSAFRHSWHPDLNVHRIIEDLRRIGEAAGCYKVILDCSEKNVGFYERCGFKRKEVCMAWYVPPASQPAAKL